MNQKFILSIKIFGWIFCFLPRFVENNCSPGTYENVLSGNCDGCYKGCGQCTGYQQKDCQECLPPYQKIQLQNQFICSLCPQGQYYDASNSMCQPCQFDCDICLSLSKCLVCKKGYVFSSINQDICSTIECAFGYYRNPQNQFCEDCTSKDANSLSCYVVSNKDEKGTVIWFQVWPSICKDTFQFQYSACGCYINVFYNYDNQKCQVCGDPNCFVCTSINYCQQCKYGYVLNSSTSKCVLKCDELQYTNYFSHPNLYCIQSSYIEKKDNKLYCKQFQGYDSYYGCFLEFCRPLQFKLFDPSSNSFKCVSACPIGFTANIQTFSCIKNSCTDDISQKISGQCFHRTCPVGQYFQIFQNLATLSKCIPIDSYGCLKQQDENIICQFCKISLIRSQYQQCVSNCEDTTNSYYYYYVDAGQCNNCPRYSCSSQNFQYKYEVNGVTFKGANCPFNYQTKNTDCIKCSDPNMINCDSIESTTYLCDWGEDNKTSDCKQLDLTKLLQKSFDQYGNINNYDGCMERDPNTQLCQICYQSNQYNFKGICSEQFKYPTRYFIYFDVSSQQYLVLDQCYTNQFVQKVNINSVTMNVCKDFADCLEQKTEIVDGVSQQVCSKCPPNFYNIFGSCIDDCPDYTYKNKVSMSCETPISYCSYYYSYSNIPQCSICFGGYVQFKEYFSSTCIPYSSCTNGFYYDASLGFCSECQANCLECLSNLKCIKPADGYFLHNFKPIKKCPQGTFLKIDTCVDCGQFCLECTDENTCQTPYNGSYFYLLNNKVFIFLNPICSLNQYFDEIQGLCQNCDSSCTQCYKAATQCLLCSDSTMNLFNFQCVKNCPTGYYSSLVSTTNYSRNVCLKCDASCFDCINSSTYCLSACSTNYFFYKNSCLLDCPASYKKDNGICYRDCLDSQTYDPSSDLCCEYNCARCSATQCTQCNSSNMFLDTQNPKKCILTSDSNCLKTDISTGDCTQCKENYKADPISSLCHYFIQMCITYDPIDPTKCQVCQNGYELTIQKTCCGVQNCEVCSSQEITNCLNCRTMYNLDLNYQCVFDCKVQDCEICEANNQFKCDKCITNYKFDSSSQRCVFDCQVENCKTCIVNNQLKCSVCDAAYKLDSNTQKCIKNCLSANCLTCLTNDEQKCKVCQQQYKLDSNNNCIFDCQVKNCQICATNDQNQCSTCESMYKIDQKTKQCMFDCQVLNCQFCQTGQQSKCQSCLPSFKLDQQGSCAFDCFVQNCLACVNNNQNQCQTCASPYKLDPNTFQCIFDCQVSNCQTCQPGNQQKCQTCLSMYKLDSNSICQFDCKVQSCQSCQIGQQMKCQTCQPQYKLTSNSQCVFDCQVQNCYLCKFGIQNQCQQCLSNYNLDLNNICYNNCKVANCQTCISTDSMKCADCVVNYQLDSNQQCELKCQIQNCQECQQNNAFVCQNCMKNYTPDSNNSKCLCKAENCLICNPTDGQQCKICKSKYKLNYQNQCEFDCLVPNCQICAPANQNFCQSCLPNYSLDNQNNCVNICQVDNCQTCLSTNSKQCFECDKNYELDLNLQCILVCQVINCKQCVLNNPYTCQVCKLNYQLDSNNSNCLCQVQNCQNCSENNGSQCQTCISEYKLDSNNKCIFDCQVQNCQTCIQGNQNECQQCLPQYILDQQNKCFNDCWVSNCQTCISSNPKQCYICNKNYEIDQNQQCELSCLIENCRQCLKNNPNICQNCEENYLLDRSNSSCLCQVQDCVKCKENNGYQCQMCENKYILDDNNQCVFDCQAQNCLICSPGNQNKCEQCLPHYSLDPQSNCINNCLVANCLTCISTDSQKCFKCNANYEVDNNSQCVLTCQVKNCKQCQPNNPYMCLKCESNYLLDSSSSTCTCQVQDCQKCSLNDGKRCKMCKENYKLDDNLQCILQCKEQNCKICTPGSQNSCQQCLPQFILDQNNNCVSNCLAQNCKVCVDYNQNQCKICSPNYFLDKNQSCILCQIKNCQKCSSSEVCQTCQQDYKLNTLNQCEKKECDLQNDQCYQINLKLQENIQITSNIIRGFIGFITFGLFFFTPIQIIISLFDFLQTINLLTYINVNYPISLYIFLKLFDFSNFEFLPSLKSDDADVPSTFGREKFDSNFYSNLIQPSIIWAIAFFIYFLSYPINLSKLNKSSKISKIFHYIYEKFFYQIFTAIVFLTFYKINLSVQLQIYGQSSGSIGYIYLIISLLILASQIVFVVLGLEIVQQTTKNSNQFTLIQKLSSKFQEFSRKQFALRYHFLNGFLLLRKILLVSILVFKQDDKITQIILIQGLFSLQTLLLLVNKPYPEMKQNSVFIFCNFCFLISILCINGLIYDDIVNIFSKEIRESLAAIPIFFLSLLFISYLVYVIQLIKRQFKQLLPDKQKISNSK